MYVGTAVGVMVMEDVPSMRPLSMHDKLGGAGEKIGFCVESCMLMLAGILREAKEKTR
jgi:hypothetical protein